MKATRRGVLGGSFTAGAGLLFGCSIQGPAGDPSETDDDGAGGSTSHGVGGTGGDGVGSGSGSGAGSGGAGGSEPEPCPDPFEAGELLETVAFTSDDNGLAKNTLLGQGWDARLYTDLENLDLTTMIVPNENFFVRTRYPDQLNPNTPWSIDVSGRVSSSSPITMNDLTPHVVDQGIHVMECSGNFRSSGFALLSAASWSGVPISQVLDMVGPTSGATSVLIGGFDGHSTPSSGGHSTPGASWIFTLDQLLDAGAFLATEMNGVPLPDHHGKPVRLLVPGWYGCSCIKWVDRIELVDDGELATSQMREFASRTHQSGVPTYASSYKPASIDQTAMPIRIEKWRLGEEIVYRVVGIMWGGSVPTTALSIAFDNAAPQPVDICPNPTNNQRWWMWTYAWSPSSTGYYDIHMVIDDPTIVTKRLDTEFYRRETYIDEV